MWLIRTWVIQPLSTSLIMSLLISNHLHILFPLPQTLLFPPLACYSLIILPILVYTYPLSESLLWHPIWVGVLPRCFHSTLNSPNSLPIFNCQLELWFASLHTPHQPISSIRKGAASVCFTLPSACHIDVFQ